MSTDRGTREADFRSEILPHLDSVYRFALRLTGSEDGAEDLVQETFLRAWRSFEQFKPGTRAKSWLFTICRNVFLRQVERGKKHGEIVEREAPRTDSGGYGGDVVNPLWADTSRTDPEGDFFGRIVDDEVLAAIDALPEEYRTAVVLSDVEGFSYQEIGDLMEIPVGTVKSRLFRGRRQLQKVLYDYAAEMGYLTSAGESA